MIISCPECNGKFRIDPSALGAAGRTVRCSKCAHTWRQLPPDPEIEPAHEEEIDPMAAADAPSTADSEDGDSEDGDSEDGDSEDAGSEDAGSEDGAAADAIDRDAAVAAGGDDVPVRRRHRSKAAAAKPSGGWSTVAAWSALVVVIGGLAAGLFWFRDTIMDTWPETAGLYDRLDLAQPGFGLVLAAPRAHQTEIGGATALVIEGSIVNPTSRAREVPRMLRLRLLDKNKREVQNRTFASPVRRLMPEQSAAYKIELKDPAEQRDVLLISFAAESK